MTPYHCEQLAICQSLRPRCADCPVLQSAAPVEAFPQLIEDYTALLRGEE